MEVDHPPGPRVVVPSNAPPLGMSVWGGVRVCAEPGCGALLEYHSTVGSRCYRCTIRCKARDFYAMRGGASNGVGMLGNINPHDVRRSSMNGGSVSGAHQPANPSHPPRPFMSIPHQIQRPPHLPISHSFGGVPGPYLNHFNSRGEMVQLASRPIVPPLPTSPIRLCNAPGCNAVLLPQYHHQYLCKRCQQTRAQPMPPPAPVPVQSQMHYPLPVPPSKSTFQGEGGPAIDLTNLDAGWEDAGDDDVEMGDDLLELELTYPEPPPPPPPPVTNPSPTPFVTTPLISVKTSPPVPPQPPPRTTPVPRAPPTPTTNHRKRRKFDDVATGAADGSGRYSRSESGRKKTKTPVRKTSLKLCASPNCTGVVPPDSRATRCVGCVMRGWRRLTVGLGEGMVVEDDNEGVETGSEEDEEKWKKKEKGKKKAKKKKGVTWADEAEGGGGCLEKTRIVSWEAPLLVGRERKVCGETLVGCKIKDKEMKGGCAGLVGDEDVNMEDVDKVSVGVKPHSEDAPNLPADDPPLSTSLPPSLSPPPYPSPPISSSPSSPTPSPIDLDLDVKHHHSTTKEGHDLDLNTDTDVFHIPGWDSDLSDLPDESDSLDSSSSSSSSSKTDSTHSDSDSDSDSEPSSTVPKPTPSITGLKIRIRIPPTRPATPIRICESWDCSEVLEAGGGYKWKVCALCRARKRARALERGRRGKKGKKGLVVGLDEKKGGGVEGVELEDALDYLEEESTRIVPGAQLCSVRTCIHIIPSFLEYRWKMCSWCRERNRRRGKSGVEPPSLNDEDDDMPMARATARRDNKGRCQSWDCGMLLAVNSTSVKCKQCLARRLIRHSGASQRRSPKNSHPNSGIMDLLGRIAISLRKEYPPDKPRIPSPYIEYRSLSSLLEDFRLRLGGFFQAQSYHFMCSSNGVDEPPRALFGFDGEFSVVALDLDVPGRKAEVEVEVLRLKCEVERLGRVTFSPKRMVSIFDFGIVTRFVCTREVPMLKSVVIQPGGEPTPAYSKMMQGELEISVFADKSHRFLPGQKTIVRFRLIG